jgi:hypothetical protein
MYYEVWIFNIDKQWVYLDRVETFEGAEKRADSFLRRFSGPYKFTDPETGEPVYPQAEVRKVATVLKKTGF